MKDLEEQLEDALKAGDAQDKLTKAEVRFRAVYKDRPYLAGTMNAIQLEQHILAAARQWVKR